MKILKYLFFLILILFIGVAVYFGTQDGNFNVTETRVIDAPPEVVFNNINDYRNWELWGSWMEDETVKITYPEKTAGEGSSYSWKSKDSGDGAMQTLEVTPYSRLRQKIVFNGTLEDNGYPIEWNLEPVEDGTKTRVTWIMEGKLGLFEKIIFAVQDMDIEENVSEMYATSLNNLNEVLQRQMGVYNISVDGVTGYGGGYYLYNTTAAKLSEIGEKVTPMLSQIENFMEDNDIPANGKPFVVYIDWDTSNRTAIFTVGIPTRDRVIIPDGNPVLSGYMPAITTLKTTLKGNHTFLTEAWEVAETYIMNNNLNKEETMSPFEIYTLKFPEEKNPANWVTEIYIPLQSDFPATDSLDDTL